MLWSQVNICSALKINTGTSINYFNWMNKIRVQYFPPSFLQCSKQHWKVFIRYELAGVGIQTKQVAQQGRNTSIKRSRWWWRWHIFTVGHSGTSGAQQSCPGSWMTTSRLECNFCFVAAKENPTNVLPGCPRAQQCTFNVDEWMMCFKTHYHNNVK